MGALGDNLLKITEFPFSYSLISLLTVIFLGEGLLDQPLEKLAPLLILMGFVATTLSMTDPVGVVIKESLYGLRGRVHFEVVLGEPHIISRNLSRKHPNPGVWQIGMLGPTKIGFKVKGQEGYHRHLIEEMMKMPIFGSNLHKASSEFIIKHTVIISLAQNYLEIFSRRQFFTAFLGDTKKTLLNIDQSFEETLDIDETSQIFGTIVSLKKGSLGTVWIVREIDKITAMVYFLIVVSILIYTLVSDQFFNSGFLDKFLAIFQGSEPARITILVISAVFVGAVSLKVIKRLKELRSKSFATFLFLLEREAIRIEATKKEQKDTFDKYLQEIEQYFNNGDWTLAELLVQRVMSGYDDFIRKENSEKRETTLEEPKDLEKKLIAEDIKDIEIKKFNYQDVGIY